MNAATIIDPEYNWKQAASQEGVDYDAVRKSFMDQAYGFVANKAKVLFQDPFRLGFEIVHRNEKATKMVGIFAFRCNQALLYAPVFFVNGEIKAADMLYRGDVKRFVPLTDDWCAFLVRGANQESGKLEDKSRQRQADAYMDRLAYPQRTKYAATEHDSEVLKELLLHSAADEPMRKIMPSLIDAGGPDTLEKLASLIEDSEFAQRYLVENYTEAELTTVNGWQEKVAAAVDPNPEEGHMVVVRSPEFCKSAAERDNVMENGYSITDNRPNSSKNAVVVEIDSGEIQELSAGGGHAMLMMHDGKMKQALILSYDPNAMDSGYPVGMASDQAYVYLPEDKELKRMNSQLFGEYPVEDDCDCGKVTADKLQVGKVYAKLSGDGRSCSDVFHVCGTDTDGDSKVISWSGGYGNPRKMHYSPDRKTRDNEFVSDDTFFIEVAADVKEEDNHIDIEPKWTHVPMDSAGVDKWMRTAGNLTESCDVEVKKNDVGLFSIKATDIGGNTKVAHDLGMLATHLKLANDFELTCDAAGDIISKVVDKDVHRVRIFDTTGKCAFMTRMNSPAPWLESYDSELGVKLDSPQRQVVQTHTPERMRQTQRYGDHYDRIEGKPNNGEEDDGLPNDALMTKSPEELAQLATQYQMPHIFDHGMLGQMAKSTFNTIAQMQQYIPDLETGVDKYFRILFLLRYRPADFEEAYGKDELMEMESELSELASTAGDNLLRLLKRLDLNKVTNQGA